MQKIRNKTIRGYHNDFAEIIEPRVEQNKYRNLVNYQFLFSIDHLLCNGLEKVMMILYPDIVRQIAENEGDIGDDGVGALYSATSWFLSGLPNRYREVSIRDRP